MGPYKVLASCFCGSSIASKKYSLALGSSWQKRGFIAKTVYLT
jgi:hypothetical protein